MLLPTSRAALLCFQPSQPARASPLLREPPARSPPTPTIRRSRRIPTGRSRAGGLESGALASSGCANVPGLFRRWSVQLRGSPAPHRTCCRVPSRPSNGWRRATRHLIRTASRGRRSQGDVGCPRTPGYRAAVVLMSWSVGLPPIPERRELLEWLKAAGSSRSPRRGAPLAGPSSSGSARTLTWQRLAVMPRSSSNSRCVRDRRLWLTLGVSDSHLDGRDVRDAAVR
jgi:hypothetical protein